MPTDILVEGFTLPTYVNYKLKELICWMMLPRYLDRPKSIDEIETFLSHNFHKSEEREDAAEKQVDDATEFVGASKSPEQSSEEETCYKDTSDTTMFQEDIKTDTINDNNQKPNSLKEEAISGTKEKSERKWIYWVLILLLLGNALCLFVYFDTYMLSDVHPTSLNDSFLMFYITDCLHRLDQASIVVSIVFSLCFFILICIGIKKTNFKRS